MKRVYLVHRWSGGKEDDWRPWLRDELTKKGYVVKNLAMPDPEKPTIEKWVNYLRQSVGMHDTETYFVGHSIGCQAILRYLETIYNPVGGAVFVSGWLNMTNITDPARTEILRQWVETPLDLEKVKTVLPKSTLIISDNDPYGYVEENKKIFSEMLGSKVVVLHNAGHITQEDGFTTLPEALAEF